MTRLIVALCVALIAVGSHAADSKRGLKAVIFFTYDDSFVGSDISVQELSASLFDKLSANKEFASKPKAIGGAYEFLNFLDGRCDVSLKCEKLVAPKGEKLTCPAEKPCPLCEKCAPVKECGTTPKPVITTTPRATTTTTPRPTTTTTTPKPKILTTTTTTKRTTTTTTTRPRVTTTPESRTYLPPDPTTQPPVIITKKQEGQPPCKNGATNPPDCCLNKGKGPYCCLNGVTDNPDCCANKGKGPYCCLNGVTNNPDCCANKGKGPYCCLNGVTTNPDCCENNGSGPYCCTNGSKSPNCCLYDGTDTKKECQKPPPPTPKPTPPPKTPPPPPPPKTPTTTTRTTTRPTTRTTTYRAPYYIPQSTVSPRLVEPWTGTYRTFHGTFRQGWTWEPFTAAGTWKTRKYTTGTFTTTPKYERKDFNNEFAIKS